MAQSHVYSDLCMSPDNTYVDETSTASNLLDILHGDGNMLTATAVPNYMMEDLITGEDTGRTKRKADSGDEPPKKRSKASKKSTVAGKQTSKPTTVKQEKQRFQQPIHIQESTPTEVQAIQSTSASIETRTVENLHDFNHLYEKKKQTYSLITSCIESIDSAIRECSEISRREHLLKQNGVQICKTKSSEPNEHLIELRNYYNKLAQDSAPEICLVCKTDKPSVIGSCGHCFLCFKCYVSYLTKALANNNPYSKCLKCHQLVNLTMLVT